jgi:hypothetical protein
MASVDSRERLLPPPDELDPMRVRDLRRQGGGLQPQDSPRPRADTVRHARGVPPARRGRRGRRRPARTRRERIGAVAAAPGYDDGHHRPGDGLEEAQELQRRVLGEIEDRRHSTRPPTGRGCVRGTEHARENWKTMGRRNGDRPDGDTARRPTQGRSIPAAHAREPCGRRLLNRHWQ